MPRLLPLLLLALLFAAAPAQAQDRACTRLTPKPEPTEAEKQEANLESLAAQRAEFGFRHDIPYVRELVRRGVWEYDVGYIPVTPRENVYLKLRDKLELGVKADRYLRRHRDVVGGLSVEDAWPREPYLLLRFTEDVARHLAAVKKLARYPDNLRARRVRYGERELQRLADRIWDDQRKLEAAGFHLVGTGSSDAAVEVDLITKRTDAAAYFRKRYGSQVDVSVEATELFRLECAPSGTYEIAPDGLSLVVYWESGGGAKPARVEVTEYPDRVEVGAVEQRFNGPTTLEAFTAHLSAALTAPLGDRPVIDVPTGKRLRQVGPSPGEPPCPAPPAEQTRLEQAIEARQEYGMRADAPYVERRLNSRAFYTKAEQRWISRLPDLEAEDERDVDAYLRAHQDEYGGSIVSAKYPSAPVVVYRFTGNAAAHERALKRRSKTRVRVETVAYTAGQLTEIEERISEDARSGDGFFEGYGRAGFSFAGAFAEEETGTVVVRVITARPDHAAYFAARYGPLVRTELIGDRYECAASYRPQ